MNSLRQNLLEVIKPASQTTLKNVVVFVHFIIQYKNLKIEINFHASYFFFGELKDPLLSMGGKGQRILRIIWFLGGVEGGSVVSNKILKGTSGHLLPMEGGGVFGVLRILQSLWEDQINFIMTKPKCSDPSPLNKTKILRPLSP